MSETVGYIHSMESFGAVDGPGIRFVVFMQGCPLRCLYCHNPDTWNISEGTPITPSELVSHICEYKNFLKRGGVTFSGGEPLMQPQFLTEAIELCKSEGLHTAVDTSGGIPLITARPVVEAADLLLLDIKDIDNYDCKVLTGHSNTKAMEILNHCEYIGRDVWIRHVVVPGFTLNREKLDRLGNVLSWYNCVKRVELIPFHKLGEHKWELGGVDYTLHDTKPPTAEEMQLAKEIMRKYELPVPK